MPSFFACPNRDCHYQFDADILPAAAMVTCPVCRTKFPYRAGQPMGDGEPTGRDQPRQPRRDDVVKLNFQHRSGWLAILLVIMGILGVTGVVVVALVMRNLSKERDGKQHRDEAHNLIVEPLGLDWKEDDATRVKLGANIFVRKRAAADGKPDAYIALAADASLRREPRPSEIEGKMRSQVRGLWTNSNVVEREEKGKLVGKEAKVYDFDGFVDEVHMKGEIYTTSYHGIYYIWYAFAEDTSWDTVKEELAKQRAKVKLDNKRESWKPEVKSSVVHAYAKGGYQVEDPDSVWIRARVIASGQAGSQDWDQDPTTYAPGCTMAFRAKYVPRAGGDSRRRPVDVYAAVVEMPQAADSVQAAADHLLEQMKMDFEGQDIKFEKMEKSANGVVDPTGATIGRFFFRNPGDRTGHKLIIVSAINHNGKTIAVQTKVNDSDAASVEQWMVDLAASLRVQN
jgi:hypothetical protein